MSAREAHNERRNFHRVPIVCSVWQRTERQSAGGMDSARIAGRTLNLSDGGALIQVMRVPEESHYEPRPGQSMELTLALPRATVDTFLLEHVKVKAEIVRVASHGIGQPPSTLAVRFGQPVHLQLD